MTKFKAGDWVRIEYGEYEGQVAKIAAYKKSGEYLVVLYDNKDATVELGEGAMKLLPPYVLNQKQLQQLARAEISYEDLAEMVFPQFNLKAEKPYTMKAVDIKTALTNINKDKDPLPRFKRWFWIIINVLYDDLKIGTKYDESIFSDFPKDEKEIFSTAFGITEKLYWRLEERFGKKEEAAQYMVKFDNEPVWEIPDDNKQELEESAYYLICTDITDRIESYQFCKGKPQGAWVYSPSQMRHVIGEYTKDEDLRKASPEERALFKDFVKKLYRLGDIQAIRILAWSHYEGNVCYRQNWNKAKKYMLELFEKAGDPSAANSLGYIYFYGRCNNGEPEYEEAFKYFSYGALDGIDESIYKVADMLIHGTGVRKNVDMGMEMLVNGYRETLFDLCQGNYDCRFAEYAFRMGDASKEGLIYGLGNRDAYRFYLETKMALEKRKHLNFFGEAERIADVEERLSQMAKTLKLDLKRDEIKADYPIFINQMYEDKFPVKVRIYKNNPTGEYMLKISRFSFSDILGGLKLPYEADMAGEEHAPKILVTYPELSYSNIVSEIEFRLESAQILKMPEGTEVFYSDGFRKNEVTNAMEFYGNNELIAAIEAKWFVIKVDK